MKEVESNAQFWESEAKEAVKREARAEAERDATRHEVAMARVEIEEVGSAQSQMELELARVQHAFAASEQA